MYYIYHSFHSMFILYTKQPSRQYTFYLMHLSSYLSTCLSIHLFISLFTYTSLFLGLRRKAKGESFAASMNRDTDVKKEFLFEFFYLFLKHLINSVERTNYKVKEGCSKCCERHKRVTILDPGISISLGTKSCEAK